MSTQGSTARDVREESAGEFEVLVQKPLAEASAHPALLPSVVTVQFHSLDARNQPLISRIPELPGELVPARTIVPLDREQIGADVVVVFDRGELRRPIIVGVIRGGSGAECHIAEANHVNVGLDDGRVVLSADRELVLRCGTASVTLTKSGKIIIQGAYISSRAIGVHRIKGGSVQIN